MGILRTNEISGLETPTAVTGSVVFDGTGDFVTTNYGVHIADSWTVEFWYNTSVNDATMRPMNFSSDLSGSNYVYIELGSSGNIKARVAGAAAFGSVNAPPVNQWHHTALSYDGSTAYFLLNGQLIASQSVSYTNHLAQVRFGADESNTSVNLYTGYISNARLVSGEALYTTDYTVPTHAFEVTEGTQILCFNNPDSVTATSNAGIGTVFPLTASGDPTASSDSPPITRDFTFGTQFQGVAKFDTQGYFVPPSGTTEQRGRGRGVFAGGNSSNTISYVTIATTGNSSDFGDLLASRSGLRGGSSATRGLFTHSSISPYINTIEYVTISSTGNAIDFGDMLGTSSSGATGSNSTRSVFWEGTVPSTGVQICYVTTASLGNASEFGDMFIGVRHIDTMNSPTRCIVAGGWKTSPDSNTNVIQYITFATTGDAVEFGDVVGTTNGIRGNASTSSSTRGVYAGGANSPGNTAVNTIEYLTMSSLGNTQDFGDLSIAKRTEGGGTSNGIRGIFAGGYSPAPANFNTIEYITIASTGDAMDFGDLSSQTKDVGACSDSHGGIS